MDKGLRKARKLGKASGIKLAPLGHHDTREDRRAGAIARAELDPSNHGDWRNSPAFEEGRQRRAERHAMQDMRESEWRG